MITACVCIGLASHEAVAPKDLSDPRNERHCACGSRDENDEMCSSEHREWYREYEAA